MKSSPPLLRHRLTFAVALGTGCALYVVALGIAKPEFVSDFDQIWAGARALLDGHDPYQVVGPDRAFDWRWPLYYPVPALLLVSPLGLLPVVGARALFAGLSAALLAWGVTRDGWQRVPIFISVSFLVNVELAQWSALYAAAFFLPPLAVVGMAKPNLGVAVAAGDRTGHATAWLAGGTGLLVLASLVVQPAWYEAWMQNLREAPHFRPPILRPFGFLLLLAALRWRRPEARWLLAVSLVPLPPSFYDQLLLAVVCTTFRESLVFAASTCVLFVFVGFNTPQPDYLAWGRVVGSATVWICYLPVLVMVLRRPNTGEVPFLRARAASAQSTGG